MHQQSIDTAKLRQLVFDYAARRMDYDPVPLDQPQSPEWLWQHAGNTITDLGLGGEQALELFAEVLAPATISTDHPNYLSFIPTAPTEASTLFDLVVSASSIYGGSWMEGAGAVFAENQVLSWLSRECGLPEGAGGVFVQGGTLGNLSALVTARHAYRQTLATQGSAQGVGQRLAVLCSSEAHSSLKAAAHVMDIDIVPVQVGEDGRLRGSAVQAVLEKLATEQPDIVPFAVVATAGTTNFGIVDEISTVAKVTKQHNLWLHIDGAYGLAARIASETRSLFDGVELADSFIVDPHKWLFAPFDACALVYRNPELAKMAHAQHGEYLDTLTESGLWNPSDYAFNLTRRVRGLPLWFSLAAHGVQAYRDAVSANINLAKQIGDEISARPYLTLVRPVELSVVVFERVGWHLPDYQKWSDDLLQSGFGFVVPSSHRGRPNLRFAIVNPLTKKADLLEMLDRLA